jgi:2-dehydro-3-deoxyphosphogluconate aldolase/(4S)-4-hydroxy-2-oxoglutarate aldolase
MVCLGDEMTVLDTLTAGSTVIPVLTIHRVEDAVPLARALVRGGLRVMEVTLRTPAGADAARAIREAVPEAVVVLGTVLTSADLEVARRLDIPLCFSPGVTGDLLAAARKTGISLVPGVQTASEIMLALSFGFGSVKFFPAVPAGGTVALRTLSGPFPGLRVCPTGGIDPGSAGEWLALPNVFAVGGSWIAPPSDIQQGRWGAIEARAAQAAALSVPRRSTGPAS